MYPIEEAVAQAIVSEYANQQRLMFEGQRHTIQADGLARAAIRAYRAALKAEGYAIVPLEPTEDILTRAGFQHPGSVPYEEGSQDYRDLVKAASGA